MLQVLQIMLSAGLGRRKPCIAATKSDHALMQDCAYLCNMAVDPEWRRQGYGQHLLHVAELAAGIAGKQEIYLHVR